MGEKRIVYVSGPMTGLEDYNHPAFREAGERLKASGLFDAVINPSDMDEGEKEWSYYLKRDLRLILEKNVTDILLLPGWDRSKGAMLEVMVAGNVLNASLYLYEDAGDSKVMRPMDIASLESLEWSIDETAAAVPLAAAPETEPPENKGERI